MARRRWLFFGPRIERERNIDEYLEEIRRTPSTLEPGKRWLKPSWRDDTPVPTETPSTEDSGDEPEKKGGAHRADNIVKVDSDYHPMWTALDDTAKALWNLRFMGYARYTVPARRLRDWCIKRYENELSDWAWMNVDFIEWPEHWKTA